MIKNFLKAITTSLTITRNAGHSKWANIRHTKGAKDQERSLLFNRLGRQMKVAITEGGSPDPLKNLKLSQIIDQAKRSNMPAATIQSIIKTSQNDKNQAKSHLLEIKGPGSCIILCEVFTNNINTLKQTMATILKKHQSKYGDGGGIHCFEEKGQIDVNSEGTSETEVLEKATDDAIESGAEDVKIIDENLRFICGKTNLNSVVKGLENLGYKIESASVEYIPVKMQGLQDSELQICGNLYEKLEALPEVVRLSDNIA